MIRWPWTSVARLEDVQHELRQVRAQMRSMVDEDRLLDAQEEITWLREKNDHLTEQLVRVQRHQVGLHETPREPRPAMEPMPRELHEYIKGFANKSIQKAMRDAAYRRHGQGEAWDSIMADAMRDDEPEGAEE